MCPDIERYPLGNQFLVEKHWAGVNAGFPLSSGREILLSGLEWCPSWWPSSLSTQAHCQQSDSAQTRHVLRAGLGHIPGREHAWVFLVAPSQTLTIRPEQAMWALQWTLDSGLWVEATLPRNLLISFFFRTLKAGWRITAFGLVFFFYFQVVSSWIIFILVFFFLFGCLFYLHFKKFL